MQLKPNEVLTVPCRLAFASLFRATAVHPTTPDKLAYQATILIPAGTDLTPFKRAIVAAMEAEWGKTIPLTGNGMPLKSNKGRAYAGFDDDGYHLKVKANFAPQVVDQSKTPIMSAGPLASADELARAIPAAEARVYAGCWCHFYIATFAWDNAAGKGVSFNLNAVQLVRDGDRLDGRKDADDIFGTIDGAKPTPAAHPVEADDPLAGLMS